MNRFLKYILLSSLVLILQLPLYATHNRAGEITYRQIGPLTIEMTITTYTKNSSTAADRDSLDVFWGDGTNQNVRRNNNLTKIEANDIKINYYIATHTYPGVATYTISFLDPNRIGGILNVNYPNSIDIPFFLSTTFTLLDQQFQGFNNSAVLLQPPIDIGCVNKLFIHNPNAFDLDGDSLSYELTAPLQGLNSPVPGYKLPDEIGGGLGNSFTINPITGEIRWDSPKLQGEYNIAIRIKEYRNGKLINIILRDMQILIRACENEPPTISSIEELCVVAGDKIEININVNDPNQGQKVLLSATGGPFEIDSPATLAGPKNYSNVSFSAKLEWQTTCNHISDQYYQIVLRAVDNFYPDSTGLATLKTIRIKVVGPSPTKLTTKSISSQILLEWEAPYSCEVTENNYFQGFSIWRKIGSQAYQPDTCDPGLSKSPYARIASNVKVKENGVYYYTDTNIDKGYTYCYRIEAEFAKLTASNNPFNRVESLPSNEACLTLLRDIPLITKASVTSTDISNGQVNVKWVKPIANQLDTLLHPGPYAYQILRAGSNLNFNSIATYNTVYFNTPIDTNYFDSGINTLENQYFYIIAFFTNNTKYGESPPASTVFLRVDPSDKINLLYWNSETPWSNTSYTIYKKNDLGLFVKIGETNNTDFEDKNVINGVSYCYKIESIGTYSLASIEDPIVNFSQEVCAIPFDNVAPCPPVTEVHNVCDQIDSDISGDLLFNTINWTNPFLDCPDIADDIQSFNIYYAQTINDTIRVIENIKNSESSYQYLHYPSNGILGCYSVTAIDDKGNESALGTKVCVDNCPSYTLPNTFTPNGDGFNDTYVPTINLFIANVDMKIFNQWGNLVFQTTDPEINWDGATNGGAKLADGTYYYTCRVFENRVSGVIEATDLLSGFINIIR